MKSKFNVYPGRRQVLVLAVMAITVYVLLPQIGDFRSSWSLLEGADTGYAALALVFTFATYAAGAGTYRFLAFKPLAYLTTVAVELAATFVNRLLPAGIGALGANYLYLRHKRHTSAQAVSVAAMNNLVGFSGHALLLAATLLAHSGDILAPHGWHGPDPATLVKWALPAAAVLVVIGLTVERRRLARSIGGVGRQIASYRQRPADVAAALCTSITLTACNVLSLFFCALALDINLPFATVLLVFTLGVGAGSAVPTPGGLGGFEAGLAAGFVSYGIDPAQALAAALLYRFVSYWLPLVAGGAAFVACGRRGLFGT